VPRSAPCSALQPQIDPTWDGGSVAMGDGALDPLDLGAFEPGSACSAAKTGVAHRACPLLISSRIARPATWVAPR
jgi:hypothetical protein